MTCPVCRTRLHPRIKQAGRKIACPDCETPISLPKLETIRERLRRKAQTEEKRQREVEQIGQYQLARPATKPAPILPNYLNAQAEVRTDPPPPPPRWTFFSDVFTFPWQGDSLVRWGFFSLGMMAVGIVGVLALMLGQSAGPFLSIRVLATAFLVLPAIWLSAWTFSYGAACCLQILEDTAAGNRHVVSWPEPVWKEWALQLIQVVYIAMLSGTVAYGLARLAEAVGISFVGVWGATFFLIFPVFLLSSLEANSPWVPLTAPILGTLSSLWWGWLLFYLLTAGLWGSWLVFLGVGYSVAPLVTTLLNGPISASVLWISARLLGRLAWRANQPE